MGSDGRARRADLGWSLEWAAATPSSDEIYLEAPHARGLAARCAMAKRAQACARPHLGVDAGNAPAQALYRSAGFAGSERRLLSRRLS
jgi:hypothetical protein